MSQDMYDAIAPNILTSHINGLEDIITANNIVSQTVNVTNMSAALSDMSSTAASIYAEPIESAITVCNMTSDIIDNSLIESIATSAFSNVYGSSVSQEDIFKTADAISNNVPSMFLEESAAMNESAIEEFVSPPKKISSRILELFTGISGLTTQLIGASIAARMQEIQEAYEEMFHLIHDMIEDFKQFLKDLIFYYTERKLLSAAIAYNPVLTINCVRPPGRIAKFCTYSYRIRKTYLRLSRERDSSDNANYTLLLESH